MRYPQKTISEHHLGHAAKRMLLLLNEEIQNLVGPKHLQRAHTLLRTLSRMFRKYRWWHNAHAADDDDDNDDDDGAAILRAIEHDRTPQCSRTESTVLGARD